MGKNISLINIRYVSSYILIEKHLWKMCFVQYEITLR